MADDAASDVTTVDAVLGGRLSLAQPRRGHRVGHDAVLLAAAVAARPGEHVVDLGAGVGGAGLALASRLSGVAVTLVEIDPVLAALAEENIARNSLSGRVRVVVLDVTAPARAFAAAGLGPGSASHVLMNPPFSDPARHPASPERGRRLAHGADGETLGVWTKAASRLLAPRGTLTLIWRADGFADVAGALSRGFGGLAVMPLHPRPGAAAIRILVRGVKGSRAPLSLLPSLVLADAEGRPTREAEAVLRGGAALPLGGADAASGKT